MTETVEVVVKIPKYYLTHPQDYSCLAECVRRGIPLPKGHGDLKDTEKLKKAFITWSYGVHGNFTDADIANIINKNKILFKRIKSRIQRNSMWR